MSTLLQVVNGRHLSLAIAVTHLACNIHDINNHLETIENAPCETYSKGKDMSQSALNKGCFRFQTLRVVMGGRHPISMGFV